jgi:hypothetical protein
MTIRDMRHTAKRIMRDASREYIRARAHTDGPSTSCRNQMLKCTQRCGEWASRPARPAATRPATRATRTVCHDQLQTETATLYRTTSTDEFRSQTDSYGYARRTAEMTAAEIEGCRAEVWPALHYWSHSRDANGRVQPLRDSYSGSRYGIDEFRVMAYTDQTGVEIIKRRPGVTLREWVRRCWKKGINPRVLNPYLPAGYEEKHGLDYWGNDLRATSDAGKAAVNA